MKPVALVVRTESGEIRVSRHLTMPHAQDALRRLQRSQALGWALIDSPIYAQLHQLGVQVGTYTARTPARRRHNRLLGKRAQPELATAGGGLFYEP